MDWQEDHRRTGTAGRAMDASRPHLQRGVEAVRGISSIEKREVLATEMQGELLYYWLELEALKSNGGA